MFGMKIQMNEEKILRENVINLKKVYQAIDEIFDEAGLRKGEIEEGGVLTYWGNDSNKDWGRCTAAYMILCKNPWFEPNCKELLLGSNVETTNGEWEWGSLLESSI